MSSLALIVSKKRPPTRCFKSHLQNFFFKFFSTLLTFMTRRFSASCRVISGLTNARNGFKLTKHSDWVRVTVMQFLLKENQRKLILAFQSVFLWKSHANDNSRQLLCIFTRSVRLQVLCCIVYCWEWCILTDFWEIHALLKNFGYFHQFFDKYESKK